MKDYGDFSVDMQSDDAVEACTSIIRQKLDNLSAEEPKCYIYRVNDRLRNLNKKAYEPEIIAIGPYHHDTPKTKLMEKHKWSYLKSLLQRENGSVDRYVSAIGQVQQEARCCYADPIKFCLAKFTEMMLLDGCFIIELLLRTRDGDTPMKVGDPIFETQWMLASMKRDLMLFENQIPFFVLCKLFSLVEDSNYLRLLDLIKGFFSDTVIPGDGYEKPINTTISNPNDIKHLLALIHVFWSPDPLDTSLEETEDHKSHKETEDEERPWEFIMSVTKLSDANVKFQTNDQKTSLFDIAFINGTLKLSPLRIEDNTEALFRNLIAYEQYFPNEGRNFITDYVTFLDCLIDSSVDVGILRQHKILDNWLGTDEVISNIFLKLGDSVTINPNNFYYAEVCNEMNEHCKKRRNNWMAILTRKYLSNPWAILSLIGGVVLLLLTAIQTVCSVLQISSLTPSNN